MATIDRGAHWEYGFWLTFDRGGSVRLTRTAPSLSRDERAMFVKAEMPKSL